jgi:hypothetical protein
MRSLVNATDGSTAQVSMLEPWRSREGSAYAVAERPTGASGPIERPGSWWRRSWAAAWWTLDSDGSSEAAGSYEFGPVAGAWRRAVRLKGKAQWAA